MGKFLKTTAQRAECPACTGIELRRQGRNGFLQNRILLPLGWYPWECGQCRGIYLLRRRRWESHQPAGVAGARTPAANGI